ncbi:hypothetical protein [Mycolicibacterium smegmatis]|uniref:hypothetical protein n=1 Tax=Mycolicibacterium smegmatis TaxID=1772 RepID=UPI0005657E4C|nr:hypothetical protein [Mycolicibacterium smegmatis]
MLTVGSVEVDRRGVAADFISINLADPGLRVDDLHEAIFDGENEVERWLAVFPLEKDRMLLGRRIFRC